MPRKFFGRMPIRVFASATISLGLLGFAAPLSAQPKPIRPAENNLRVNNVDPALLKILKDWEKSSAKIKKLEGQHKRWEYDFVFRVAKQNIGKFYYESPDKGRIDLEPDPEAKPKNGQPLEVDRVHWQNGKTIQFKVQEGQNERWYCDGQVITQVDEVTKSALQIVIPKENQGVQIMDGPLPFLFGMPAEKALRRFEMKLIKETQSQATIHAVPLLHQDASNYRLAQIILNLETYLPEAVRLIDPAGTKETVFTFKKVKPNASGITELFKGDPFRPNLRAYKVTRKLPGEEHADQEADRQIQLLEGIKSREKPTLDDRPLTPSKTQPAARKAPTERKPTSVAVPTLVGIDWKEAERTLKDLGLNAKFLEGDAAPKDTQTYRVQQQDPDPKSHIPPGETVKLWLYTKPGKSKQ